MSSQLKITLFLAATLLAGSAACAQMPDKFTNLKFFPKDITRQELMGTMRRFSFALGVRCEHCHVEKADHKLDFPADDKDEKKTARLMLQMVAAINKDYIGKIGKSSPARVECVTCHHGLAEPRTMNGVLAQTIDEKGIDAAVALYHDLRKQYYGSGEYDFGETPLNQLAEALLAQKKVKEAVAIEELNFSENHPDGMWSYHMLAQAHEAAGDTSKALADYRKVLELHPDDDWAKKQIAELSKPK